MQEGIPLAYLIDAILRGDWWWDRRAKHENSRDGTRVCGGRSISLTQTEIRDVRIHLDPPTVPLSQMDRLHSQALASISEAFERRDVDSTHDQRCVRKQSSVALLADIKLSEWWTSFATHPAHEVGVRSALGVGIDVIPVR